MREDLEPRARRVREVLGLGARSVRQVTSEKKTSLLCFVLFANMSLVLVQFPIPVYINLSQLLQNY